MNVLLHICCAPCLIYPLELLRARGVPCTGFFYNPNIAPPEEYRLRREALELYRSRTGFTVIFRDEETRAAGEKLPSRGVPGRCRPCWRHRLRETARWARSNGFDAFSTTLLVSPYQDHDALRGVGEDVARETGCDFYYEDFRPGFRKAGQQARSQGLYRQKYCGCRASFLERCAVSAA